MRPNCTRGEKDQSELRVRSFPFTEHRIGNLANQRQSDRGRVVPLHIHKRFDQFALIDANEFPRFAFKIPDADIGEHLQSRAKTALRQARSASDAAQPAGLAIEKTDQPVALAERKGAKNNGLRLLEWHSLSRRADRPRRTRKQIRATKF